MPLVITPEANIPLPFDTTPDEIRDFHAKAKATIKTIRELEKAGLEINISDADKEKARDVLQKGSITPSQSTPGMVVHLESLLSAYDQEIVGVAARLKHYITNRLIEETENPDPKVKLKALELLGKTGDVGLFAEKVEVTHTHKTSAEIEQALLGRIEKYMGAIEVVPDEVVKVQELDRELNNVQDAELVEETPFEPKEFSITELKDEI